MLLKSLYCYSLKKITSAIINVRLMNLAGRTLKLTNSWHPFVESNPYSILKKILFSFNNDTNYKLSITDTGVLQVAFDEYIYMISTSSYNELTLRNNYRAWKFLFNSSSKELVDYNIEEFDNSSYYFLKVDKLQQTNFEVNTRTAFDLIDKLPAKYSSDKFNGIDFEHIKTKLIQSGTTNSDEIKLLLPSSEPGLVGYVHGDFHPDNIMINKSNKYVFIDLDRFLVSGARVIDIIHWLMINTHHRRKYWVDCLFKLKDEAKHNLTINDIKGYFLFRIQSESLAHNKISKHHSKLVLQFLKNLKAYNNE